ncbi:MAG: YcaQ family DNA glycosylase [Anaerolineae bacterium]|nr:YcaQ family DNA glycosylase [Anaerolineae bacterium]
MSQSLTTTPTLARRLAIACQRLNNPKPAPTPDGIREVMQNLRCLQLDPIRAVERTQYLVLWSRLGPYDVKHLDTLLWEERSLFEYWAHAASIVLTEDYPLHQLRMRQFPLGGGTWNQRIRDWLAANESFRQHIIERLAEEGPLSSNKIDDLTVVPWESSGWNHNRNVGQMLSYMWGQGDIMVAGRRGLQKQWALAEHHLPDWYSQDALLSENEIVYQAAQKSLRALGVATTKHIDNHFTRNRYPNLANILAELVAEQRIIPISVQDDTVTWPGQWYIHADDVSLLENLSQDWQPRTTLLSPFDNLICDRDRTEFMWDFYFRIEIYVPKAKRQYGYYVLPILHGDQLIGRIDPRMDRKTGIFHVNAIYLEPDTAPDAATAQAVITAIEQLAKFLGAEIIQYNPDGIPVIWEKFLE